MKLLFERSVNGRQLDLISELSVKEYKLDSKLLHFRFY